MEEESLFVMLHILAVLHLNYKLLRKSCTIRGYSMDEMKERTALNTRNWC